MSLTTRRSPSLRRSGSAPTVRSRNPSSGLAGTSRRRAESPRRDGPLRDSRVRELEVEVRRFHAPFPPDPAIGTIVAGREDYTMRKLSATGREGPDGSHGRLARTSWLRGCGASAIGGTCQRHRRSSRSPCWRCAAPPSAGSTGRSRPIGGRRTRPPAAPRPRARLTAIRRATRATAPPPGKGANTRSAPRWPPSRRPRKCRPLVERCMKANGYVGARE